MLPLASERSQSPLTNSVPSICSWIRAFGRYLCIDYTLIISSSYGKSDILRILEFLLKAPVMLSMFAASQHMVLQSQSCDCTGEISWKLEYLDMIFCAETFGCSQKVRDDFMELEILIGSCETAYKTT